jgi:hypothetical protein
MANSILWLGYGQESPGFDLRRVQQAVRFSKTSTSSMGPTQPPLQWVLSSSVNGRSVNLTFHLHLVPRFRISGTVSYIYQPTWLHVAKTNSFTFDEASQWSQYRTDGKRVLSNAVDSMDFVFCENTAAQNTYILRGSDNLVPEPPTSGVPRNFFRGVQQIQLRTEGRENGDLGAVAP